MSVAATLPLAEAAARAWDVIVVGAGPAGAVAARELARRQLAVLLVDRATFPRWKVCGCCLNRWALATLSAVGLAALPDQLGAVPLERMELVTAGRRARLSLPEGRALSRERFDAALASAAIEAGAAFLPATSARLAIATPHARSVFLRQDGSEVLASARIVLAATGLGGGVLAHEPGARTVRWHDSRLGAGVIADVAPASYAGATIFMACGRGGYVGLVRIEDGRLDLAAAFDPAAVQRLGGLGTTAAAIIAEAGLPPVPGLEALPWRGTPLLTQGLARPAAHRILVLGDAAGYAEPFTGEGIAWALACAEAVAPIADAACRRWHPGLATQWTSRYRRVIARRRWVCRAIARVLRSPRLTRGLVFALERMPSLAAPFTWYVNSAALAT